jgi:hypothetical protein
MANMQALYKQARKSSFKKNVGVLEPLGRGDLAGLARQVMLYCLFLRLFH